SSWRVCALHGVECAAQAPDVLLCRRVPHLVPTVDEAGAAGVLAESGSGLRFRHPLIHAALYEEMPVAVRVARHRDAGRVLAEADAPADRVARQLLRALGGPGSTTEPLDGWMLRWLARTADLLVAQAPQAAAGPLRRALATS